jgi:AcrR family transcriptional regulator|tara:strand:+ start:330 stop:974 length:645 start_codon:yes stop_codon:yes gene_type:complete
MALDKESARKMVTKTVVGETILQHKELTDGRYLRAGRSRKAMVDAACELMDQGVLAPTAQEIADRAGVGIRTLFRLFEGVDDLYAAVDELKRPVYDAKFIGGNREGSLRERLLHAVGQHALAYEELSNVILCTLNLRWRSPVMRDNYVRANRRLRKDLEDWLPELTSLPRSRREAVDAVASFEMWHRLREHQHLSKDAAIDIIYDLLKGLIVEP